MCFLDARTKVCWKPFLGVCLFSPTPLGRHLPALSHDVYMRSFGIVVEYLIRLSTEHISYVHNIWMYFRLILCAVRVKSWKNLGQMQSALLPYVNTAGRKAYRCSDGNFIQNAYHTSFYTNFIRFAYMYIILRNANIMLDNGSLMERSWSGPCFEYSAMCLTCLFSSPIWAKCYSLWHQIPYLVFIAFHASLRIRVISLTNLFHSYIFISYMQCLLDDSLMIVPEFLMLYANIDFNVRWIL